MQLFDIKSNEVYYNEDTLRKLRSTYKEDKIDFLKLLLKCIFRAPIKLNRISLNAMEYKSIPYTSLVLLNDRKKWHNLSEALTGQIDYLKIAKEFYDLFGQKQSVLLLSKPYKVKLEFRFDERIKEMLSDPVYIVIERSK